MNLFRIAPSFTMKASPEEKDLAAQQANFYKELTGYFNQQYATQKGTLDFMSNYLKPLIENPTGYSPETLTAMRTQATDNIATAYQNATKSMQNRQFVLGGRTTPSGVTAAQQLSLSTAQAATNASAQNAITTQNEALKQTNFWNAISALSGVGGMQNPSYLLSGANTAGQNAFSSAHTINQEGMMSQLGNIMGGLAGGVLGGLTFTKGSGWSFNNG